MRRDELYLVASGVAPDDSHSAPNHACVLMRRGCSSMEVSALRTGAQWWWVLQGATWGHPPRGCDKPFEIDSV